MKESGVLSYFCNFFFFFLKHTKIIFAYYFHTLLSVLQGRWREEQGASLTLSQSLEPVVRSGVGLAGRYLLSTRSWLGVKNAGPLCFEVLLPDFMELRTGWAPGLAGQMLRGRALDLESETRLLVLEDWVEGRSPFCPLL